MIIIILIIIMIIINDYMYYIYMKSINYLLNQLKKYNKKHDQIINKY